MLNIIRESFDLTNKYIILATPLILFSLISSLYLAFSLHGNIVSMAIAVILFFLMLGAFLSGWFYMILKCIKYPDTEEPNQVIKEFTEGVGEYFLPVLGMLIKTFFVAVILFIISYIAGMKLIGDTGISSTEISAALTSVESLKTFLLSLSNEQLIKINAWNILLFLTMSFTYFLIMFYSPAMFFKEKNPIKSFWIAIKDLFSRHFFKNLLLFIFIFIVYSIISILMTIFGENVFAHFILTLLNFYFFVFAVVLVYNYYYANFVKIGSNIDTRI
ncbi:hypothetical protein IJ750_01540 [bacterium]|nr:hypothetical protein [bacterium]